MHVYLHVLIKIFEVLINFWLSTLANFYLKQLTNGSKYIL